MSSLIALHKIEGYIQTIYLAEYADSLLLLDGCSRPDVPKVLAFIEHELARKKEDLKLVVVTHMHPDHVGGVQHFRKLTGCQVASADISGQWYQGLAGGVMHLTDIGLAHFVASRQKNLLRDCGTQGNFSRTFCLRKAKRSRGLRTG
ncbi:MBL fold metallo-hydrolase [Veronia pacifica]|uniref:MBL fold metallo-hydrolase n=1 Tax=Veronia pacifica TaxID=1080227 RepID=UPI0026A9891E